MFNIHHETDQLYKLSYSSGDESNSNSRTILHNIDPEKTRGSADPDYEFDISIHAAMRKGNMKIITGPPGMYTPHFIPTT